MPAERRPNHIPIIWLLLDVVGMAVIGLGFATLLGKVQPLSQPLPGLGWVLILAGLMMIFPLFWKIRAAARHIRAEDDLLIAMKQGKPRENPDD